MNEKTIVILYLITVLIDKGIPAVATLLASWRTEDPTLEDWKKLKTLIVKPSLDDVQEET